MRRAMEMGGGGQTKANEGQECGDRVYDQYRRERFAGTRRQVEIIAVGIDIGCE